MRGGKVRMKTTPFALLLTLALGTNFASAQDDDDLVAFQECIQAANGGSKPGNCYTHLGISDEDVAVAAAFQQCIHVASSGNTGNCYDRVKDWRDSTEHSDKSLLDTFAASWWKGPGN